MRRRDLLAGLGAVGIAPRLSWADAQSPAFLSAARHASGSYHLCGLDGAGAVLFTLPLPDRGHAAAAHPTRPEAVAFARRPGRFAVVLDCARGAELARLTPPPNRHFYGHGTFSSDGGLLFTTENDLETLDGRIGLWDANQGYARIGDIPSGGIGPHDVKLLTVEDILVVANGGIATHPESGRTPLNLPTMRSNLAFVTLGGRVEDVVELDIALRQNSIRHLAVRPDGLIAAGMQWNGPSALDPALLFLLRRGQEPLLVQAPPDPHAHLRSYVGSVSFSGARDAVAVTSPRGSTVQVFDPDSGALQGRHDLSDVCGIAPSETGFFVTAGTGQTGTLGRVPVEDSARAATWAWDNHLVPIEDT